MLLADCRRTCRRDRQSVCASGLDGGAGGARSHRAGRSNEPCRQFRSPWSVCHRVDDRAPFAMCKAERDFQRTAGDTTRRMLAVVVTRIEGYHTVSMSMPRPVRDVRCRWFRISRQDQDASPSHRSTCRARRDAAWSRTQIVPVNVPAARASGAHVVENTREEQLRPETQLGGLGSSSRWCVAGGTVTGRQASDQRRRRGAAAASRRGRREVRVRSARKRSDLPRRRRAAPRASWGWVRCRPIEKLLAQRLRLRCLISM